MKFIYWMALLFAVFANIITNIALKKFATGSDFESGSILKLITEPWLWLAGVTALLLVSSYVYSLRGLELSIAYPTVTSLAMVGSAIAAALIFGESLDWKKIMGLTLILGGVVILTTST